MTEQERLDGDRWIEEHETHYVLATTFQCAFCGEKIKQSTPELELKHFREHHPEMAVR